MDISILIPTCNRITEIGKCLSSLRVAVEEAPGVAVEVILGNDGPPEDVPKFPIADFPCPIRVLQGPRQGPARNRNQLANAASGGLIVFIDDDVKIFQTLIAAYAQALRDNPEGGIFEGRISRESEPRFAYEEVIENETGGYLWTANLGVKRDVFLALGGFDIDYPFAAMEDTDFRYRASCKKIKVVWCPNAVVSHPIVDRKGALYHAKHRYSLLLFLQKHPEQLGEIGQHFTLIQCLRVIKYFLVKRSWLQPVDGYLNIADRIGTILKTRSLVLHPERIPQELRSMEAELRISPRMKATQLPQNEGSGA